MEKDATVERSGRCCVRIESIVKSWPRMADAVGSVAAMSARTRASSRPSADESIAPKKAPTSQDVLDQLGEEQLRR